MKDAVLLKLFIREFNQNINEGPIGLALPYILSNLPGVDQYDPAEEIEKKFSERMLAGKKFSLTHGGDPDFVAFAENKSTGIVVIRKFSKSNKSDADFLKLQGARYLYVPESGEDPIVKDLSTDRPSGWSVYQALRQFFDFEVGAAKARRPSQYTNPNDVNKRVTGFFIIDRVSDNFKQPAKVSTEAGLEKLTRFECVLSVPQIVDYIVKNIWDNPTSPEFAMAAACCYEYSTNSIKAAVIVGGAGAVIGAPTGVGAWVGLGLGLTTSDIVLRSVVIYWAWANNKKAFMYANIALLIINALFAYADLAGYTAKASAWFMGKHIAWGSNIASDARALEASGQLISGGSRVIDEFADAIIAHGTLGGLYNICFQFLSQCLPAKMSDMFKEIDMAIVAEYLKDPNKITRALTGSEAAFAEVIDKYPRY